MPIGATIGAAAITAGGSYLGGQSQKKAANKAADTSLAVADKNNALSREIYAQNTALLNPYNARGNIAGEAYNALLGLPSVPIAAPTPVAAPIASAPSFGGQQPNGLLGQVSQAIAQKLGRPAQGAPMPPGQAVPAAPVMTVDGAKDAFDNYLNSAGYQFRLDQGNKAINQGYAARGALQSGAALKALQGHGQDLATDYFKDYLGLLANQQGVGLSGASAVAGVGQNYANSVSANNNSAGSAAANAALTGGVANAGMYSGIANSLGQAAGTIFNSSYGQPNALQNDVRGMILANPGVF